ncbi:MAG: type II toxin-antitoxin system VapC family toxin [Pseudonocardiaceae bacterium]
MIVVDASVLVNALADDDADGDLARSRLLADPDLHAPSLVELEVLSVLRRQLRLGRLDNRRADLAVADLRMLPLIRYPHLELVSRVWALRDILTPYNGAYIALAETLDCSLVTSDKRLARVSGAACPIEVLG